MIAAIMIILSVVYPFQCIEELPRLHDIEASIIWDDEVGWLVPDDAMIIDNPATDEYEVFALYSQSADSYYLIVFDGQFTPDNIHPCGAGAIDEGQYQEIIEVIG